jgi:PAS domain S-box-containing protein
VRESEAAAPRPGRPSEGGAGDAGGRPEGPGAAGADEFRALFEAAPAAFLVLRPDAPRFTVAAASDEYLRDALLARGDAVGRGVFEVLPDANPENPAPTGVTNLRASLEAVLRTRRPHRMVVQRYDVQRPDGSWDVRYWAPLNLPVTGPDGAVRYVLHHVEDVTDREHDAAERGRLLSELAAEHERLRAVVLHMPAPVALLSGPDHRFELVNDPYRRVSGGGRDVTGLTPEQAFPELAGTGIFEHFDRVYATGESWVSLETPVRFDRDGDGLRDTWFDLRFEPVRDAAGRVTGILNLAVDVTAQVLARRQTEALLAQSERAREEAERARAETARILFAAGEGILGVDTRGRTTFVNPAAERLLGWTADELVGRRQHELIHHTRPDGTRYPRGECALYRAARDGTAGRVDDEVFWRKDGTSFPVEYAMTPATDAGRVVGAVVTFRDVTERRESEAERERLLAEAERARAAAEAANRAKSEFLATMSHELRTPLNAIAGYADLMEMGVHGPLTDPQREALGRIQRSGRRLLSLINEVLNYARIEAGAVSYAARAVRVAEAVAEAEALVAPQLRGKGLGYAWAGCDPALAVCADPDKLQQILLNLLSNAVKFTEPRDGRAGRVEAGCDVSGDRVHVRVRDTGIGIPADKLEAIFDPFVQVQSGLTRRHEGTGLGLAISRDLARGMGGDLAAESAPGEGSTFTLTLPRA